MYFSVLKFLWCGFVGHIWSVVAQSAVQSKKKPPEIARSDSFNTTSITSTKNQKLNTSEKGSHAQMLACSSQQIYQPSVEVRSICPLHHESPFAAPLPPQRIPNHPPRWSWPNIATAAAKDKPWLLERGAPWRDNKKNAKLQPVVEIRVKDSCLCCCLWSFKGCYDGQLHVNIYIYYLTIPITWRFLLLDDTYY